MLPGALVTSVLLVLVAEVVAPAVVVVFVETGVIERSATEVVAVAVGVVLPPLIEGDADEDDAA